MAAEADYHFSTFVNQGIIEIAISGEVAIDGIDKLSAEVYTILKGMNARGVLCDIRTLKGSHDGFTAAYFRARSVPPEVRKLPSAIVHLSDDLEIIAFYETTAINAGHSVKWFTDIEDARTWLRNRLQETNA